MSQVALSQVVVFAGLLFIRLAIALALPVVPLQPDFAEYQALARQLAHNGNLGFGANWAQIPELAGSFQNFMYEAEQATFRPPGFPALLCGLAALGLPGPFALQVVLAACDALVGVVLWRLGRRWASPAVGWVAAAVWGVMPGSVYMVTKLGREPILALATIVVFAGTWKLAQPTAEQAGRRLWLALGVGVLAGMGALVKETLLPVAGLAAGWLVVCAVRQRSSAGAAAAAVLIAGALLASGPWMVRNSLALGRPTGLSSMGSVAVALAIVPTTWRNAQPPEVRAAIDPYAATDPLDAQRRLGAGLRQYLAAEPGQAALAIVANVGWFWSPVGRSRDWGNGVGFVDGLSACAYLTLFVLAAIGGWRRRDGLVAWATLLLVIVGLLHGLSVSTPRYRIPFEPIVALLAAEPLVAAWRRWFATKVIS